MDMLDAGMSQTPGQNGKKGPDFREILSVVWRKKWLLIIPFVVCFLIGIGSGRLWPKSYESESVLQFPRLGIEGEISIQDSRFHQTKFRERAEQLLLKVRSSSTWMKMLDPHSEQYRSDIKFINRDEGPSLFYRLKNLLFTGSDASLKQQGLNQQIENIIANIRVEISETDPSVRITCIGNSTTNARDICYIVTKLFTETDDVRLGAMEEKKNARQDSVNDLNDQLVALTNRLNVLQSSQVSAQLMRYLQESLRNVSITASSHSTMYIEARSRLYNALLRWRLQPKEKKMAIDLGVGEGEKQGEQADMLVRDLIAQYETYLKGLDKNAPDYARNAETINREIKRLRIQKAIEDDRIYKLMYLNALENLEAERAVVVEEAKQLAAEIKKLIAQRDSLLETPDIDTASPEVVEIDKQLEDLKRQASKSFDKRDKLSGEILVYQRLKRLLAAKDISVDLEDDQAIDPDDETARVIGIELSQENYELLEKERNEAAAARDSISDEWYDALESVIIAYKEYFSFEDSLKELEAKKSQIEERIEKGNKAEIEIQNLEKNRAEFSSKLADEEERLQSAEDAIKYIDRMIVFVEPTWNYEPTTNSLMILAGFAFLGLVVGVGLVVITELADSTVKNPRDLRGLTNQPVLATIPTIEIVPELPGANEALFYRTKKQVEQDIASGAMFDGNYLRDIRFRNIATEQIRKLRSSMIEAGVGREARPRTFLITSALAGEGKTTIAANLAIAISQMIGEHVLLVDSDLRQPDLHNLFNLAPRPGLAEYLSEDIDLADLLVKTEFDKLTLLQAGKVPANSTELLGSDKMWNLIKELRSRYDDRYILIDSPPIMSTSEPAVLAEQVDGIILVVRAGVTPREIIEDTLMHMDRDKVIGIVMNDVKTGHSRYYVPTYIQNA